MVVMSRLSFYYASLTLILLQVGGVRSELGEGSYKFKPAMAIVMIAFVIVFFALGSITVYVYMRGWLERLLEMDNWLNVRQTTAPGLEASVIETFPTFRYSTVKKLRIGKEALECPVCLNEFEDDETLRLIPQCCHVFHLGCIDAWLRSQTTCPLCRANLVPVPGESVSLEIPGLGSETGQNSVGSPIDDSQRKVLCSPDKRLIESVAWTGNQSMGRKSMSTGWKLAGLSTPSSSPPVQTEENLDRFTLRLPQEIHNQLVNSSMGNQGSKGQVALPEARSSVRGYRTGSLRSERNYFYSERFDHSGRFHRRPFSITPPYHTNSIQSPEGIIKSSDNSQERTSPPKGLFERSYLRSGDASPV